MGIRLLPDADLSISGRLNFCKVSPKVWLTTLSKVRPLLSMKESDVFKTNDDNDKYYIIYIHNCNISLVYTVY